MADADHQPPQGVDHLIAVTGDGGNVMYEHREDVAEVSTNVCGGLNPADRRRSADRSPAAEADRSGYYSGPVSTLPME